MANDSLPVVKPLPHVRDVLSVFLSALLLVLSFPKFDLGFLVWIGLLPLLIAIHGKGLRHGFLLSFFCGVLFFIGISHWIFEVPKYTVLHHALLMFYLGLYFGFFGLAFNFISSWGIIPALFSSPFIWVSLEYIRSSFFFLSLPWELLAHSQYQYPVIIQIASLGGTYSISFIIVLVNAALAAVVYPYLSNCSGPEWSSVFPSGEGGSPLSLRQKGRIGLIATTTFLALLTLLYGQITLSKPIVGHKVKISVVQGNIEQSKKWDPKYADEIMQIYADLTKEVSKEQPALIIWPETATPGAITQNPPVYMEVINIAKNAGTNLLFGSAQHQKFEKKGARELKLSNSAYLLQPKPIIPEIHRYDKIRLFPFGEYLPYKDTLPWSLIQVERSGGYSPGKEVTVFKLPDFQLGVTICWEIFFPDLVRRFIEEGAQFIVNITNEAWFGKSVAPYQLASISVFRAVENRVFVVRCANTGISCIIDPYGRIIDRVKDEKGQDIFIRGVMSGWVMPLESGTIYTRYGDLIVRVAIFCSAVFLVVALINKRVKYRGR